MSITDPEARREYQRQWVAARREEFLRDKCCVICASTVNLELDHVDPNEKIDHKIWSWSESRRLAELEKCQVLCQVHHLEKTRAERAAVPIPHGTDNGYVRRKCRCLSCTEAHRVTKQAWRDKRKAAGLTYT